MPILASGKFSLAAIPVEPALVHAKVVEFSYFPFWLLARAGIVVFGIAVLVIVCKLSISFKVNRYIAIPGVLGFLAMLSCFVVDDEMVSVILLAVGAPAGNLLLTALAWRKLKVKNRFWGAIVAFLSGILFAILSIVVFSIAQGQDLELEIVTWGIPWGLFISYPLAIIRLAVKNLDL